VIEVDVEVAPVQATPSIVTTGLPWSRLVPVRVSGYPPAGDPYLGLIEVTIGVLSCLYLI